jgi:hypothetical protein
MRLEGFREIWTYPAHPPIKRACFDADETVLVSFVDDRVREFGTADSLRADSGFEFIKELEAKSGCRP